MTKWKLILVLMGLLISCARHLTNSDSSKAPAPSRIILTGELAERQLLDQLPSYQSGKAAYQPDRDAITELQSFRSETQIVVFLGTWCPDSEREVPRFLKIMDLVKGAPITYRLIAVDRSKRDAAGLAEQFQIEFVPTFVVLQNDQEIGRIVESPMISMEQDLLEIMMSGAGNK